MKLSIRKMKGHKWRLFCLQLSFIPLWIAVVFTLGIGAMWLVPYEQMTYACFFMNLMAPERSCMSEAALVVKFAFLWKSMV